MPKAYYRTQWSSWVNPIGHHNYLDETLPVILICHNCRDLLTCPSKRAYLGTGVVEDLPNLEKFIKLLRNLR